MAPADFRARLKDLGISHASLARRLGKNSHTVGKWADGTTPVPLYAAYVLDLLHRLGEIEKNIAAARKET